MKIAFSGHRPDKLGNDYNMEGPLVQKIKVEIIKEMVHARSGAAHSDDVYIEFIVGMALGIDQLAATIAIEHSIPFIAAIPFKGQELMWPKKSQELYHQILSKAAAVVYVSYPPFSSEKMNKRNKWMVDQLTGLHDILIAVWDGTSGGTANCVKYAKSRRKNIIQINPKNL